MWSSRFREGLARSRQHIGNYMGSLWRKKKLDAQSLGELESLLLEANFGVHFTTHFLDQVQKNTSPTLSLQECLAQELTAFLTPFMAPFPDPKGAHPFVCMFVGVNGSGKTTTAAKMAKAYQQKGHSVALVGADLFRAAATEQASVWADRVGSSFYQASQHRDSASLAYDAFEWAQQEKKDCLFIDTAGRLHTQKNLMDELEKMCRVLKRKEPTAPHACLLVIDGTVGQNALSQGKLFQQAAPLTGIVMTKVDGTNRAGIAVHLVDTLKIPIVAFGAGEGADDLYPADAKLFARSLVGLEATS